MSDITVLGAGAFGTALAISLARDGSSVSLVARNADHAKDMAATRENTARLPGHRFPASLTPTTDTTNPTPICLMAVPAQSLATYLGRIAPDLAGREIVACCKGIDLTTGLGPTAIIAKSCPDAVAAILSGPSFAVDIAAGLPTALTIATADSSDATRLQAALSTSNLRLYTSTDVIGTELGGALKNVIAIAAGVAIGAGLGESARAALMTRGYAEMKRFAQSYGADPATLSGLSGLGDLVLTSTSEKSRNYSFGLALGAGQGADTSKTVEGLATAKIVSNIGKQRAIDMPVTNVVGALVEDRLTVSQAVEMLLSRPLRKE
ncbi:MAG: NAD(P)-dependent glycerol-3-phosphate dehydrogenase [Marinosulfonomonas sp.]|nr:NAD(P)-dependent glycerol-3-phosphate dehydrogenase [Marinosulfonomonas sp.]